MANVKLARVDKNDLTPTPTYRRAGGRQVRQAKNFGVGVDILSALLYYNL